MKPKPKMQTLLSESRQKTSWAKQRFSWCKPERDSFSSMDSMFPKEAIIDDQAFIEIFKFLNMLVATVACRFLS